MDIIVRYKADYSAFFVYGAYKSNTILILLVLSIISNEFNEYPIKN